MSRPSNGNSGKPYARPNRPKPSDGMWQHDKAPGVPRAVANTNTNGVARGPQAGLNSKLVVSNLHYNVNAKDLTAIFGQIGTLVREPHIKYDRSGRSTGIAYITYETPVEATRAKKQFDGILAKAGQPMTVVYDTAPIAPRAARRSVSAPSSLMDRIQKRPLLERLGSDTESAPQRPAAAATNGDRRAAGGPVRNRGRRRGSERPARARNEPKTAEELDKELDAFMGDEAPEGGDVDAPADADVEMA
ncbi:hypothetical protein BD410DRAFT_765817 [Rickenella mellea]|uniref:RRM domain-containing protein n=1 Tax=Rickenella mellea TaxID=50990 RepID=A0A4Y7QEA5_9AGAM|nr:hypothetical protein BD410DRAFT_765817 [Rickenella mellea]